MWTKLPDRISKMWKNINQNKIENEYDHEEYD